MHGHPFFQLSLACLIQANGKTLHEVGCLGDDFGCGIGPLKFDDDKEAYFCDDDSVHNEVEEAITFSSRSKGSDFVLLTNEEKMNARAMTGGVEPGENSNVS